MSSEQDRSRLRLCHVSLSRFFFPGKKQSKKKNKTGCHCALMGTRESDGLWTWTWYKCDSVSVFVTSPAWRCFASLNRESIVWNKLGACYL